MMRVYGWEAYATHPAKTLSKPSTNSERNIMLELALNLFFYGNLLSIPVIFIHWYFWK